MIRTLHLADTNCRLINFGVCTSFLTLQMTEGDVSICASRTSINVESNVADIICGDNNPLEWWYMCDRYVKDCNPIYLAVTGSSAQSNPNCQGKKDMIAE